MDQNLQRTLKTRGRATYARPANVFAVMIAGLFIAFCLTGIIRRYSPIPFGDDWIGYCAFNLDIQRGDYAAWWQFWVEDRPLLPRLIYWIDFRYFGAAFVFVLVTNILLLSTLCAVICAIAQERIKRDQVIVASCTIVVLGFAWMQGATLYHGFVGTQWYSVMLLSIAAFYALHRSITRGPVWVLIALATEIAAPLTLANGPFVLPLLALMSALVGHQWRLTLLFSVLACIAFVLYFHGFLSQNASPVAAIFDHPVQFSLYIPTYLGAPRAQRRLYSPRT
jgi:hypothetical protein